MAKAKFVPGQYVSLTHYAKVESVTPAGDIVVQDVNNGLKFNVQGNKLLDSLSSASNFSKTEKVTKTEIAEKLNTAFGKPFTVVFEKSDGTDRKLVGTLLSQDHLMGRAYVHDFEEGDVKKGLRQVDFRTLKSLILNNVKYEVK